MQDVGVSVNIEQTQTSVDLGRLSEKELRQILANMGITIPVGIAEKKELIEFILWVPIPQDKYQIIFQIPTKEQNDQKVGDSTNKMNEPPPIPQRCYEFTNPFTKILAYAGFHVKQTGESTPIPQKSTSRFAKILGKTSEQFNNHNERYSCIFFSSLLSSSALNHFLDMTDEQIMGAAAAILSLEQRGYSKSQLKAMSEDDQRNAIIVEVNKCNGKSVWQLQRKGTLDIAKLLNTGKCCQ